MLIEFKNFMKNNEVFKKETEEIIVKKLKNNEGNGKKSNRTDFYMFIEGNSKKSKEKSLKFFIISEESCF